MRSLLRGVAITALSYNSNRSHLARRARTTKNYGKWIAIRAIAGGESVIYGTKMSVHAIDGVLVVDSQINMVGPNAHVKNCVFMSCNQTGGNQYTIRKES